jgi:hypothetical protein
MELNEARAIVTTLANGVDPVTGEVFTADSPYNTPQVIRALHTVLKWTPEPRLTLDERRQVNLELGRPGNYGLPWTDQARAEVARGFQAGATLSALAEEHERTLGSITAELVKQGLLDPPDGWRPPRRSPAVDRGSPAA